MKNTNIEILIGLQATPSQFTIILVLEFKKAIYLVFHRIIIKKRLVFFCMVDFR